MLNMKRLLPGIFAALCASGASGTTISMQVFDYASYTAEVVTPFGGSSTIEDFESLNVQASVFEDGRGRAAGDTGRLYGEIDGSLQTAVGAFTTITGTGNGSGSTCRSLSLGNNSCDNIALQYDPDRNGQGNIVPSDGRWALNSNDTLGIEWRAGLALGVGFDRIVFALRDAADVGATLTVALGDVTRTFSGLSNGNRQLFVINLGRTVDSALVTLRNSRLNDAFTLDGAALVSLGQIDNNPPPVPLPAGVWLLMTAIGGLALTRRRRAAD